MSEATRPTGDAASTPGTTAKQDTGTALASGLVLFAAVMLMINGALGFFSGIVALAGGEVYVATADYVYRFDLTSWGWIHLILGILVFVTGIGLLRDAPWARVVGATLAGLSLIASFMFLPYYPIWSLVVIAIDVFIIWALCTAPKHAVT